MTGAPKISAMNLCTELERDARGIYAGTIGWLDGDGSAELSVVIRTLLIRGNQFEFQVGGGIVADSEPEKEWDETLAKARAIAQTLGITEEQLACL
jgi:para-aminobenzoate synthetase component 1